MSEKMFETKMDDAFDGIINITKNGENLAWFFTDSTTDEQVEKICNLLNEQQTTIEHLKERLYDFEKRKIIEESRIDEDVIPKIKLLRTELFGEKYD